MEMESITKFQAYQENLEKNNVKSLKSHLILSNQKFKYQNYITKKQYLHSDSYKKSNESGDITGISRISSMTPSSSQLQVTNKKPKGRVSFAPKYRLINYIYYDPKEVILKGENNDRHSQRIGDGRGKHFYAGVATQQGNGAYGRR